MITGNENSIRIEAFPLRVHLKTKFRHPGADRTDGESLWVKAERNGIQGFGEGCPRSYVAGDDLDSSLSMVYEKFVVGKTVFSSFQDMKTFRKNETALIDRYPSAWCAVEMALLDLFSRERNQSVEEFLGLAKAERKGMYSAVLGDDRTWRYTYLTDQYMIRGITDFKVKVNGRLEKDLKKLGIIAALADDHGLSKIRVRLDANNLWKGQTDEAIAYVKSLNGDFFAVEEPIEAGDAHGISRFSVETDLPVILDESLLTVSDLDRFQDLPGTFIANVKVSRVGGLMRALELVGVLKKRGMKIIVSCHVGETSLLTRAAMIVAAAAEDSLLAHEGAFGDYLVEWEPVKPMLRFGHKGFLDLEGIYYYKTVMGLNMVFPDAWRLGFGMDGRMPFEPDGGNPSVRYLEMPDGYRIHYRTWGKMAGEDAVIVLHGGMSHSGWQAPLGEAMKTVSPGITIIAPDRRGCGLNSNRGDLGTVKDVTDDVVNHILYLKRHFKRVHVAGWCQGCQYAAIAAARLGDSVSSLILLTPGFFWNERFRSVLSITEQVVLRMIEAFDLAPARDHACVPIPMEGTDFTLSDGWLDFIARDELKSTMITMKSASVMDEVQELSWMAMMDVEQPMLMILADKDRIVDNHKVLQFIGGRFAENSGNRMIHVDSPHAIQFEHAGLVAVEIAAHVRKSSERSTALENLEISSVQ